MAGFFCFQGSVQHLFGVDAFFHIRAAATLPEQGFVPEMPWMLESLFEGRWVDHHYGFHLLLAPFVLALGGVVGGKVYAAFAGAAATWALALWFRRERVPHALAFALLPLALSWGYAFRLGMVRAMSLSQVFLVLTLFLALHGRNRALALVTALYALSYQLAVLALPISVGALVFDRILGKKEPSTSPQEATRPNLWTPVAALVGLAVGLLIHPNAPHTLDFLTEHAATGLGSVGAPFTNEWKAPGSGVVWMQGLGLLLLLGGAGAALARKAVASRRLRPDTALLCCGALCGTALMLLSMRFVELGMPLCTAALAFCWRDLDRPLRGRALPAALLLLTAALPCTLYRAAHNGDLDPYRLEGAADYLQAHAKPGEPVYHPEWADWAELVFHAPEFRYVVGLNPQWLQKRDPERWDHFVRIRTHAYTNPSLAIFEQFKARWVVVGRGFTDDMLPDLDADEGLQRVFLDAGGAVYRVRGAP